MHTQDTLLQINRAKDRADLKKPLKVCARWACVYA